MSRHSDQAGKLGQNAARAANTIGLPDAAPSTSSAQGGQAGPPASPHPHAAAREAARRVGGSGGTPANLVTPSFVEVGTFTQLLGLLEPVLVSEYRFPDGTKEGSAVIRVPTTPQKRGEAPERPEEAEERDYDAENTQRARQQLRRFVRTHDLRRLLTFTNGGEGDGFQTRQETLDTFARWLKVFGCLLGKTPVVVVAERGGKHGRWHIHALVRSGHFLPYREIRATWSHFLTRRGFISPTGLHRFHAGDDSGKHSDGFRSARIAAVYAAKYLGKHADDDDREEGRHRYRTYQGETPKPLRSRHRSLGDALRSLGHCGWLHPLEYLNAETGELVRFGFLFDTAPALE